MGEVEGEGEPGMDRSMATVSEGAVVLLKYGSRFLWRATSDDIEFMRQELEAQHGCKLTAYLVTHDTLSGAPCTHIEWRIVE
jgi:hypothetical protein